MELLRRINSLAFLTSPRKRGISRIKDFLVEIKRVFYQFHESLNDREGGMDAAKLDCGSKEVPSGQQRIFAYF
ncbi:hypothetical protein AhaeAN59_16760 [Acinetobacter haemolyticus]|uniref:Uncharacterized protein n=1 Tax=Acinetobacter haemolyticus TaxID=29430 RepID=A0A857IPR8_ACIHA|nr:hypothetical protein AhaeAN59_16760 [Acinetobacter haemolyticus]QHI15053.1 hypothetical protein AhaeAN43_16635 [Acinetobacter haemolyticus]